MGHNIDQLLIPKYEYYIYTWGGFYNKEYKDIHGFTGGSKWFDTKEERLDYITILKNIEKELNARYLVMSLEEGYHTRNLPVIHRVVEYQNRQFYSQYKWSWSEEISVLKYHAEYKWYPGFNDYTVPEQLNCNEDDIDWTKVKIINEWITGSFKLED